MRIAIAICSVGRPEILRHTLRVLERQTTCPSDVLLVVCNESDLPDFDFEGCSLKISVRYSAKGLTRQRNAALDALKERSDFIFFMDDDYLPSKTALDEIQNVFRTNPDVVGITGKLLADGITHGGIDRPVAEEMLLAHERSEILGSAPSHGVAAASLYGCNMALRCAAIGDTRFDENLPLYGWQEDVDFSMRLPGKKLQSDRLVGVHLGTPLGRETSGVRLGYSQVVNVWYLWKKGSLRTSYGLRLVAKNVLTNLIKSFGSEPWIDRKARAYGNWRGFADIGFGRAHPTRVQRFAVKSPKF
ncbi:MAG: glycosyltransferase [Pseudomonadota bacterium]|nr:glycosyltransferase [Pseudomonadota bacterium]